MPVQASRGGRVKLAHLTAPQSDYAHAEKGDALNAMELALSLEKLNFNKLRQLHGVADKHEDAQMADFVEDMLAEQVGFLPCENSSRAHLCHSSSAVCQLHSRAQWLSLTTLNGKDASGQQSLSVQQLALACSVSCPLQQTALLGSVQRLPVRRIIPSPLTTCLTRNWCNEAPVTKLARTLLTCVISSYTGVWQAGLHLIVMTPVGPITQHLPGQSAQAFQVLSLFRPSFWNPSAGAITIVCQLLAAATELPCVHQVMK